MLTVLETKYKVCGDPDVNLVSVKESAEQTNNLSCLEISLEEEKLEMHHRMSSCLVLDNLEVSKTHHRQTAAVDHRVSKKDLKLAVCRCLEIMVKGRTKGWRRLNKNPACFHLSTLGEWIPEK